MAFGIVVAATALPCNLDYCQWQQLYLKLANKLASLAGKRIPAMLVYCHFSLLSRGVNIFLVSFLVLLGRFKLGLHLRDILLCVSPFCFLLYCALLN